MSTIKPNRDHSNRLKVGNVKHLNAVLNETARPIWLRLIVPTARPTKSLICSIFVSRGIQ